MDNKIILIDFGVFLFRAIFSWEKMRKASPTYLALIMLIANIKKVGLDQDDTVIIAVDSSKGSWRKKIDKNYKANRKAARDRHNIDWHKMFGLFNNLIEEIELNTPFHTIEVDTCEADDIIAYACKKFKDTPCVVISSDSDYEQLVAYPNVKVFSPLSKRYKEISNPYKIIAEKIRKEVSDNLVTPILTEEDYVKRNMLVNLLTLPENIEHMIDERLNCLPKKDWNIDEFFSPTVRQRLSGIYEKDKIVSEDSKKKKSKKRKRGEKSGTESNNETK